MSCLYSRYQKRLDFILGQMKMKRLLFTHLMLLIALIAYSQNYTITGRVVDAKTKKPIEFANIRILTPEKKFVVGASTNTDGAFSLNVKDGAYKIETTYLGYDTAYTDVTKAKAKVGDILLKESSILLKEAVVTGKIVEVVVKGDTVEYNADAYKTQPSAVVEDLIKKLPGAEISSDGTITINGKTVKKILVDGKEFFSDDPKVASKNLPASMVQKLQLLDKKSDMSEMTGFDDGNEETVLNLQVRPGMKQGLFGNAYAGYGTKDRYEANAMVNYMQNSNQYSLLAGSNNTNNAGFSDFASSMFSGNRPRGISFGNNNGITTSHNGGLNFNSEPSESLKIGGDVRYGHSGNDVLTRSYTQTFNTAGDQYTTKIADGLNKSSNFGANLRFNWKVDSLTRIIFRPSVQYNVNDNAQRTEFFTTEANLTDTINKGKTDYQSEGKGLNLSGTLELSRKLNTAGRTLSGSLSGGLKNQKEEGTNDSWTDYIATGQYESYKQRFTQKDKSGNWAGYLSFVEPLGNKTYLQLTYKYSNTHSTSDKQTYQADTLANDYTRYLTTDFATHNASLNFKMERSKVELTVGVGVEPSKLDVAITNPDGTQNQSVSQSVVNFAPNARFRYKWGKQQNLQIDYRGTSSQPSSSQLIDGIPSGTSITKGNAELKPSFSHRMDIRMRNFNTERGSAVMLFGGINYTLDDIVSSSQVDASGRRITQYTNVDGNYSGNLRFIVNQPLTKKLFTVSNMAYAGYSRSKAFINGDVNVARTLNLQESLGLNFRSSVFDMNIRGNISYQNIDNSLAGQTDRSTYQYGMYASSTVYLPFNFTLDTDVDYSTNSGYSSGYKQNQWLWNASLAKTIFKDKSGTIRLKVYDILNQRNNISRTSTSEYIQDSFYNGLTSYAMVHFVYKFQIFKGGAKQSDMEVRPFGPGGRPGGSGGGRPD